MSSETAAHFPEALASPSEGTYDRASNRRRHLITLHKRLYVGRLRDARRFFIELCVNLRTPAYKLLVNPALNQRHSSNISDYNVAYIVKKTLLNALVNKSASLPGAVI
jgi:hypothetical protein